MKIVVAFKVVPDNQDIRILPDGSLDLSKAHAVVSAYDLNAIEAAAQLSKAHEALLVAITVGPARIDDSKMKKNVLARGVDELIMLADDAYADMDAHATAAALSGLIGEIDGCDLVVCGDGSADDYAQQTEVQLASQLGLPVVTSATRVSVEDGSAQVERTLEDVVEVVRVALPAVVSVTPDAALPRIPGMKDILAAGKKPSKTVAADKLVESTLEVIECRAPEQAKRNQELWDASDPGAVDSFTSALKAAL